MAATHIAPASLAVEVHAYFQRNRAARLTPEAIAAHFMPGADASAIHAELVAACDSGLLVFDSPGHGLTGEYRLCRARAETENDGNAVRPPARATAELAKVLPFRHEVHRLPADATEGGAEP